MDSEVQKLVKRGKLIGGVMAVMVILPITLITILAIMVVASASLPSPSTSWSGTSARNDPALPPFANGWRETTRKYRDTVEVTDVA